MASDQTIGGNGERLEKWRQKLQPCSHWEGVETLVVSPSKAKILNFAFKEILPLLPVTDRSLVNIAFSELLKGWQSASLVEAEPEAIREMIQANLDRDCHRDRFKIFEVELGTEGTQEARLVWLFHEDRTDYEALCEVRFVQVNSMVGDAFVGYRIWKLKYPWGEALALAAMKEPEPAIVPLL
jgi:hypothetical protein